MTTMLDRWHDTYHDQIFDPGCIYCAEESMSAEHDHTAECYEHGCTALEETDDKLIMVDVTELAGVFGDGMTAMHVGPHFTCSEADVIAATLAAGGHTEAAESFLSGHVAGDEPGDTHYDDDADRSWTDEEISAYVREMH